MLYLFIHTEQCMVTVKQRGDVTVTLDIDLIDRPVALYENVIIF